MKIIHRGDTLNVSEVSELSARNCERFRSELESLLPQSRSIRIDLSQTDFMDCRGVSTLLALQRLAGEATQRRSVTVLNPNRCVRRIFGLTGADRVVPVDEGVSQTLEVPTAALRAVATALNPGQRLTVTVNVPTVDLATADLPSERIGTSTAARLAVPEPGAVLPATPPPTNL